MSICRRFKSSLLGLAVVLAAGSTLAWHVGFSQQERAVAASEPLDDNRRRAIAENTLYHDTEHPSQILLPVIPANPNP